MKRRIISMLVPLLAACTSLAALAAWPEKPITLIVPFAAGGSNDNEGRINARWLTKVLKQNVIVENRVGGNGAIGASHVARARPDGYTFLMTALPPMVMLPHTQKVNYDPFKSFIPISIMDASYVVVAVNPSLIPVKTFAELVAYAKASPEQLNYATGGVANTGHLSMSLLLKQTGIEMTHVPYKGSSEAVLAVIGKHVPINVGVLADVLPHHRRKELRIIGVSSGERLSELPDIETLAEQGYPGFKIVTWQGMLAPAGTPKEVIATMAEALRAACQDAAFNAAYQAVSVKAVCSTPEQFAERLKADWTLWGGAVKAAGLELP